MLLACVPHARAVAQEGDLTLQARYAVDATGRATVEQLDAGALPLKPMVRQPFALGDGALWLRIDAPALDASKRWFLLLSGGAFIDRASLFTRSAGGAWREQRAGDQLPVAGWDQPNTSPLFELPAGAAVAVWLRVENRPAPVSLFVQLLAEDSLRLQRQWSDLLVGAYLGFGLLVLLVGLIHGRLYGERAFYSYCTYVTLMLAFQLSFTGVGGLFFWPQFAGFNNAAPALFMLLMTAAGIWNIRESVALKRHSAAVDRFALGFSAFGVVFAFVYTAFTAAWTYALLNVYGLAAVVLSISLCLWTWRRGERYSGWLFLGFLPVHLSYPFPALRAAGVLADSWATQYAVLIGSAIEIPLLLYILHWRAKDFSENRARLRALDSTDPLTGLTVLPVLRLRVRDALRRARRLEHRCALLLVELANHAEIVAAVGREGADRALVVAAGRISRLVREIDTVCRIADNRFAILTEGPQADSARRDLAQHIVARGLEPVAQLPHGVVLKFKVATMALPDAGAATALPGAADEEPLLQRLQLALVQLRGDPRRVVLHLAGDRAEAVPAA